MQIDPKNIERKVDDIKNRSVKGRSKRELISSKMGYKISYKTRTIQYPMTKGW